MEAREARREHNEGRKRMVYLELQMLKANVTHPMYVALLGQFRSRLVNESNMVFLCNVDYPYDQDRLSTMPRYYQITGRCQKRWESYYSQLDSVLNGNAMPFELHCKASFVGVLANVWYNSNIKKLTPREAYIRVLQELRDIKFCAFHYVLLDWMVGAPALIVDTIIDNMFADHNGVLGLGCCKAKHTSAKAQRSVKDRVDMVKLLDEPSLAELLGPDHM